MHVNIRDTEEMLKLMLELNHREVEVIIVQLLYTQISPKQRELSFQFFDNSTQLIGGYNRNKLESAIEI